MDTQNPPLALEELTTILRRRKKALFIPMGLTLAIAAALAYLLPPTYRSEATVLIESQSIPEELIKTTITGYVQEQIELIRQRTLTNDNLTQMAEALDLYPDLRQTNPDAIPSLIRQNVEVDMVDVEEDPRNPRNHRLTTIAFTVAYLAESPETAQAVANRLAGRFLEENRIARHEHAVEVSDFLEREAETLRQEIAQLETAIADFKQGRLDTLPELMDMNLRMYEKTEDEIQRTRETIRTLQDQANALEAELSLTSPYKDIVTEEGKRVLTTGDYLRQLTAEYLRASARYTADHPNIIQMRRELDELAQQTSYGTQTTELLSQLVSMQDELAHARLRYSDTHPTVTQLKTSIAAMAKELQATLQDPTSGTATAAAVPDNPRYVSLKTQLDAARSDRRAEQARLAQLESKLQEYEKRLFQTPVVERDIKSLTRDYANAQRKYEELKDKQRRASLAEQLESGDQAMQFVLASSAPLPNAPDSPNRLGILLLGGFFALVGAIGSVGAAEYMDRTVRGRRGVAALLGAPPLAVVPDMAIVDAETRALPIGKALVIVAVVAAAGAGLAYDMLTTSAEATSSPAVPTAPPNSAPATESAHG